jgi:K+-sensing histidine kinase KdpD
MPDTRRPPVQDYAFALVVVALATAVRFGVDGFIGDRAPFSTYFVAIAAVGLTGRLGAAVVATVTSAIVSSVLFIPPRGSLAIGDPSDVFSLGLFVAAGCIVVGLAHRIQRSRSRLQEAARAEAEHAA